VEVANLRKEELLKIIVKQKVSYQLHMINSNFPE